MSKITLKVNGANHTVDVEPSTPLLYVLRNDLDPARSPLRLRARPMRRLYRDH